MATKKQPKRGANKNMKGVAGFYTGNKNILIANPKEYSGKSTRLKEKSYRGTNRPDKVGMDARKRAEKYGKPIGPTTVTIGKEKDSLGVRSYPYKSSTTVITNTGTGKGTTGKRKIVKETKTVIYGLPDKNRRTTTRSGQ